VKNSDYFQYLNSKEELEKIIFKKDKKKVHISNIDVLRVSQRCVLYILKFLLYNRNSSINDFVEYYMKNSKYQAQEPALRTNFYRYATGDSSIAGLEKLGFIEETGKKSQNKKQSMTYQLTPNGILYCWHIFSYYTHDMGFAPFDNMESKIKRLITKSPLDFIDPILEITAKHYSDHYPLILKNFDSIKKSCGHSLDYLIHFSDVTWYTLARLYQLVDHSQYHIVNAIVEDEKNIHNEITFLFFMIILKKEVPDIKLLLKDKEIQEYCEKYIIYYYTYLEDLMQGFRRNYLGYVGKKDKDEN